MEAGRRGEVAFFDREIPEIAERPVVGTNACIIGLRSFGEKGKRQRRDRDRIGEDDVSEGKQPRFLILENLLPIDVRSDA